MSVTETATKQQQRHRGRGRHAADFAAGGSIKFNSPDAAVSVLGSLVVPAGTVSISSGANIVVGPNALISVCGPVGQRRRPDGVGHDIWRQRIYQRGSIALSTVENSPTQFGGNSNQPIPDTSGSIILQAGSVLNLSSGGELQANGQC